MRIALVFLIILIIGPARSEVPGGSSGESLYRERCVECHETGVARAPDTATLRQMSQERIRLALTFGSMNSQGRQLTLTQIGELSRFLARANSAPEVIGPDSNCSFINPISDNPFAHPHWNGWGVDQLQSRFQPGDMAGLAPADVPHLKVKWAFGFPGDNRAFAQPTVVGGSVFVGSAGGSVYSLDAKTGCTRWTFDAGFSVRTAISIGKSTRGWSAYFGDSRGNAFAVDAESGKLLWKARVEEHSTAMITGSPTLSGTVLYVPVSSAEELVSTDPRHQCCTFRGSVVALDASNGNVLWKSYTVTQEPKSVGINQFGVQSWGPSGAAVWSAPTVDLEKHMIYSTTGDSYSDPAADTSDAFLAFRMETGELLWARQTTSGDAFNLDCVRAKPVNCPEAKGPDFDFGSSPILVALPNGKRALIAGQKSGVVYAIDPDREGAILWEKRVGRGGRLGGVQWGSAVDKSHVYVAVSDIALQTARTDGADLREQLNRSDSFKPEPGIGGGLYALDLQTGEVVWHTPHPSCSDKSDCRAAQSAAVTAIPGIVFSGSLDGHLRGYSAQNGQIIWDVDTKGEYNTVNGAAGRGGSLDGPGPVVVDGTLYVNSGYSIYGSIPGNVLLAFSVDGK